MAVGEGDGRPCLVYTTIEIRLHVRIYVHAYYV